MKKTTTLVSLLALSASQIVTANEEASVNIPDFSSLADYSKYSKKEAYGGLVTGDSKGGFTLGVVLTQNSGLYSKAYITSVSYSGIDSSSTKLVGKLGYGQAIDKKLGWFADAGLSNYSTSIGPLSKSETGLAYLAGVSYKLVGVKTKVGLGSQNGYSYTHLEASYKINKQLSINFLGEMKDSSLYYVNAKFSF